MTGKSPEVYEEMMGDREELALYLRMPDLSHSQEAILLSRAPQLFEGQECFLRVIGLPDFEDAWIN